MAGFRNNTNGKRVAKILDILDLLEHSRQSNRADVSDMADLLRPVLERLTQYRNDEFGVVANSIEQNVIDGLSDAIETRKQSNAGNWSAADLTGVQIRDVAAAAPFKELLYAVAVAMNRIAETVDD